MAIENTGEHQRESVHAGAQIRVTDLLEHGSYPHRFNDYQLPKDFASGRSDEQYLYFGETATAGSAMEQAVQKDARTEFPSVSDLFATDEEFRERNAQRVRTTAAEIVHHNLLGFSEYVQNPTGFDKSRLSEEIGIVDRAWGRLSEAQQRLIRKDLFNPGGGQKHLKAFEASVCEDLMRVRMDQMAAIRHIVSNIRNGLSTSA
ncbi:MAG TPA: hypothetical protein EYN91_17765 [Candidatus Melainabacteria bacterium]|nr:hypothetical protein [Candidatus Melainabacteria bacterium]HIN65268.1 hypothetical protein [Candidatus Obscuribacterales bacterium]